MGSGTCSDICHAKGSHSNKSYTKGNVVWAASVSMSIALQLIVHKVLHVFSVVRTLEVI
jgi:predicted CxxxxCH...CXXCH cytochrome family protein